MPQPPQVERLAAVWTSQPVAVFPWQSAKPEARTPIAQLAAAWTQRISRQPPDKRTEQRFMRLRGDPP
jgi:hypothetical protein